MKKLFKASIIPLLLFINIPAQDYEYWNNAPLGEQKIYLICFASNNHGFAVSEDQYYFDLKDSTENYVINYWGNTKPKINDTDISWSAEIYLSVMHTTDAGINWAPYQNKSQNQFFSVYLKNELTQYDVGKEFLASVISKILEQEKTNQIEQLINHPIEYSEFYSSENEGWAVGWYVKNHRLGNN